MPRKTVTEKPATEFTMVRDYISRYVSIDDDQLDVVALWMIGTWTFSPSCTNPHVYPYLYVTGGKGSGKSTLALDIGGDVCRNHQSLAGMTGPSLFRMIGTYDEESGEVIANYPTMACDEIDATFSGNKDEDLRLVFNVGYKLGASIPRAAGKITLSYPVHCPKILIGIDNGHLPETVTDRCIRIEMKMASPEQVKSLQERYTWDIEDESAEIKETLSQWAKANSSILRDYTPPRIDGLKPRQWEIGRALIQLARALNIEHRIGDALVRLFTTNDRPDGKVALYKSILSLFESMPAKHADRVTTNQILAQLEIDGVHVPGNSGKGLAVAFGDDVLRENLSGLVSLKEGHPAQAHNTARVQRGYMLHQFDSAFARYLTDDE
jgi:hypothetical protein